MNGPDLSPEAGRWAIEWLENVRSGKYTMSQRKLCSVERLGGGVEAVRKLAQARGVHLLMLEDDHGEVLLAASRKPFTVVC